MGISESDRQLANTTAHVLAAALAWRGAHAVLLGLGCWAAWMAEGWAYGLAVAAVLVTLAAGWYGLRLGLDARLLAAMAAAEQTPEQLDVVLQQLHLRAPAASVRSMADRCAGALRLLRLWLVLTLLASLLLLFGAGMH